PSGQSSYTWAASTTDVRALSKATNVADRIAATWYSGTSFSVDVNLTDTNTHQIAFYLLDWDSTVRTERIDAADTGSGTVLNTQSATSFNNGEYFVWNISGHVTLNFTRTAGANSVLSGLFFGGPKTKLPPPGPATVISTGTTAQDPSAPIHSL